MRFAVESVPLCFCGKRAYFRVGSDAICSFHRDQLVKAAEAEYRMFIQSEWRAANAERKGKQGA